MKEGRQSRYFSVETLRSRITGRLIRYLFLALTINVVVSLARLPVMGFQPSMFIHVVLFFAAALLALTKKTLRPQHGSTVI